ncbi:MAG: hypothetical protein FWC55_09785, partial [Firmicutes bacterium]|nr:hypothetical protein [Bacillota bacterium]
MKKTKLLGLLLALAVCLPVYGAFSPFGAAYAAESADDTASPSPSADLADIYAKLNALGNQIYDLQQIINGNGQNNAPQPEPTPTPVYAPKLKLISPFSATVTGRLAQNVEITVKNLGTSYAGSVLVQASAGGDAPFALSFPDGSNSFPNLGEGNSKTMTMRIAPDADAKSGAYPVTLTYSYKNAASENLTGTDTLTIKVDNAQYTTNVILYNFKSDKEPMTPGDSATIQATLENT